MNILYASDENFADILGISLISLLENQKKEKPSIFVLSDGIGNGNRTILAELAGQYGSGIRFIDADIEGLTDIRFDALSWGRTAFCRIFLYSLLKPYNVDRIIYLDCDIAVCDDLYNLFHFDLRDKALGMIMDPVSARHKKNVGIGKGDAYYNSGVMLVDVNKWKSKNCETKILDFARKRGGHSPFVDQGLINGALKNDIATLPLRYNVMTVCFDYSYNELKICRNPGKFYGREEYESAVENPAVIHYTKNIFTERPWVEGSKHRKKEIWLYYRSKSPWGKKPFRRSVCQPGLGIYVTASRKLPRKLNLIIQGLLHSFIKPVIDMIRMKMRMGCSKITTIWNRNSKAH